MNMSSNLTLELFNQPFLLEKRIDLLFAIKKMGSISKAAKEVPMSYKTAWDAVDSMNNLSHKPVVTKATGGTGGGGTVLTEYGDNLLESYTQLKSEHQKFLLRLKELTNIDTGMLNDMGRLGIQISARNQIQCRVSSLKKKSVNTELTLVLKSGNKLKSVITNTAFESLNLKIDDEVMAIFKSSWVRIEEYGERKSSFYGTVKHMSYGKKNVEIILDIGTEESIVSVTKIEDTSLKVGDKAWAIIDENNIMIGR